MQDKTIDNDTDSKQALWKAIRRLLLIAALIYIGDTTDRTLRFTTNILNPMVVCAFYAIPFFLIRPVLGLHHRSRFLRSLILIPLLIVSSLLLLGRTILRAKLTDPLQIIQLGRSTIELQRYENGGSVGIHGLNLEQRRLIFPGLYLVRSVGFFDDAREGTLSVEGQNKVRVNAKGSYDDNNYERDEAFDLKPWVFF